MSNIRTKLHTLAEYYSSEQKKRGREHPAIAKMLGAASYVIDPSVLDLLRRDDVGRSISALLEAGIARLPVSPMVLEYSMGSEFHEFILLEEVESNDPHESSRTVKAWAATLFSKKPGINPYALINDNPYEIVLRDGKLEVPLFDLPYAVYSDPQAIQDKNNLIQNGVMASTIALNLALLMLNTKGIEKEVVNVAVLNKSRVKSGKPAIPTHAIVHIGKIYRRDGTAINPGPYGKGGWTMPMHIRQAHTRRQHFGHNNEETKIIFVPACIVNFEPDEEVRLPHKIVKV